MRCLARNYAGTRSLLALALTIAVFLAAPSVLGGPGLLAGSLASSLAVCSDGSLAAPGAACPTVGISTCPAGVQPPAADEPCGAAPPGAENSGAAVVTTSSVGTDACPGGVAVVSPTVPCPTSASQICPTGLLLPVTQTCPTSVFYPACPNGAAARPGSPCPGLSPSSCPNGGFGPKPEYCSGI